jgi:hypothetical protein
MKKEGFFKWAYITQLLRYHIIFINQNQNLNSKFFFFTWEIKLVYSIRHHQRKSNLITLEIVYT